MIASELLAGGFFDCATVHVRAQSKRTGGAFWMRLGVGQVVREGN